jgi:toxin-antitoxin system PIN domain toxin
VILVDVNVLVYAFRRDAPNHQAYADWLQKLIDSDTTFGMADLVFSGFVRVVTHPAIFNPPSTVEHAIRFADQIRRHPHCATIAPGPRHWDVFTTLCRETDATGNLVPDAYLAALAIESGAEWITADRGFAKFRRLRWRHPFN